ncbi:preprotein translocase subunit SecY [bacterium]|nr:preprotein translocase subunit SecY [bacterium]
MIESIQNIFKIPDLRKKILYTLLFLGLFRLGAHIPIPGVDLTALSEFMERGMGGLFALYDLFVGGAFRRATIFAAGIMPYITASIILQLLGAVIPYFQKLQKEGEEGRRKLTQYTRYGALVIAFAQGFGMVSWLASIQSAAGPVFPGVNIFMKLLAVFTLVTGTAIVMWFGELITEKGIGNGMSLLIFAGIVARLPGLVVQEIQLITAGGRSLFSILLLFIGALVFTVAAILLTQGTRQIPVQYAKRVVGRKIYGGQATHLPMKLNAAGVIPIIFAQAVMFLPNTILSFFPDIGAMRAIANAFSPTNPIYNIVFGLMVVFFAYFYTAVVFNPVDVADNMKKYGGFIPGRRPGKQTSAYIDKVLTRITLPGSVGLALIATIPIYFIPQQQFAYFFSGTSLLILVGVALDTLNQLESHLLMRHYEGFMKKGRIRGRR